jgi:hypothetical protein
MPPGVAPVAQEPHRPVRLAPRRKARTVAEASKEASSAASRPHGLPPTLAEIDAFAADMRPAYGGCRSTAGVAPLWRALGRPWLDLARYADSHVTKDNLRTMWNGDWVIKARTPTCRSTSSRSTTRRRHAAHPRDQLVATGFHRNTLLNQEGGIDVEEARWETLIDRVNTTGTVWLGTTIACAQCHNHKYDPFSQRDFYRMVAFYDNGQYSVFGQPGGDHWIQEASLDITTPDQEVKRAKLVAELKDLNAQLTDPSPDLDRAQAAWEQEMARTAA